MVFTIRCYSQSSLSSWSDSPNCCRSSAERSSRSIYHHRSPTDFHCHTVTSVEHHAKYLKEWSYVTSVPFTITVTHVFEDQYMKHMSVIQPSETGRVTSCCWGTGISWVKMLYQRTLPATNTNPNPYPKMGVNVINLVSQIWGEGGGVKVQKVKGPLSLDTSVGKYFLSLHLHLVFRVMRVSGTVETKT